MANTNIINAVFGSGLCAVTTSAFRANYGMVLRLSGIELPTAFEVDFSNYDVMGRDSITMIGQNNEVQIPDDLWESGLNIYAYVYLHPTDDSGVTVYTVTIPVLGRPNRTEEEPTPHEQSVIEQAISALNDAVEQTAADVESTTANAQAASQSEANAATSERSAAALAGAALASQNAAESASQSATESASGAAESARNAAQSASQAAESATNAQASAAQAERSVQSISGDVERAEQAATTATNKATEAASSASTASGKATEAASSASSAASAAQNAVSSAQTAQSSASGAEQAKQDAQDAQAAAEQAAERAEQAEQEVLSAMDGTYEDLTSGNAQQLLSTVTEANSVPYLFRPTASNADRAYLDELVGGTVAWNQLVVNGNFETADGWGAGTVSDNVLTFVGGVAGAFNTTKSRAASVTANHVLFMSVDVKCSSANEVRARYPFVGVANLFSADTWFTYATINKPTSVSQNVGVQFDGITDANYYMRNFVMFDLTLLFGSAIADYIYSLEQANEGAGVAYFRKLFPKPFYEYNSGELLSVNTSRHKMVGFNAYNPTTGTAHVVGGMQYQITGAYTALSLDGETVTPDASGFFTPSANGMLTVTGGNSSTTCVHLVWSGYRNGEYEPYQEWVYPLDSSLNLRGIPKLDASGNLYYDGDTYAPDGTVTRKYGIVDLGTLTWNRAATSESGAYRYDSTSLASLIKKNAGGSSVAADWIITTKYQAKSLDNVYGKSIGIAVTGAGNICIYDSDFTSGSFATFVSGVYLVYKLATPTTETADPYRHLQICDPNGTEEFVSTSIVPVGHNTRYPENLRAKIEGLPWNFNSIIAMTETTTTASKAYSVGDYFILNNVLYRVTSAIASGGTITIGTNCRATTIMDEIKALS